jgi:4-amino-4-deoxy-L-arabinose transferase-like glycosyltransferase
VVVIYLLGAAMAGRRAGMASAVVLLTTLWYVLLARIIVTDMLLCLALSFTLAGFWWAHRSGRWEHYLLLTAGAIIGSLTKGPVSLALPALIIGAYLTVTRQWRSVSWPRLAGCLPLYLAAVVPWFAAVQGRYPGFLRFTFLSENLGRFAGKYHAEEPFYFYVPILLLGLGVWALPLLAAGAADWRRLRRDGPRGEESHARVFLWLWLLGVFTFFSVSKAKLPTYILPCFPAAALLLGLHWEGVLGENAASTVEGARRKLLGIVAGGLALGLAGVIAYGVLGKSPDPEQRLPAAVAAALGLALGIPLLLRAARSARTGDAAFSALALAGFLACTGLLQAAKLILSADAVAPLAIAAVQQARPGDALILFRANKATAYFFYAGRTLGTARTVHSIPPLPRQDVYGTGTDGDDRQQNFGEALQELVQASKTTKRTFCLLRKRDFRRARSRIATAGLNRVVRENHEYVLVSQ